MATTAVPETSHSAARGSPQRVTLGVFTPIDGGVRCSQRGAVSRQTPALSVRRISSTEQPVCRDDTCPLHTRTQKNSAVRISFVISSELTLGLWVTRIWVGSSFTGGCLFMLFYLNTLISLLIPGTVIQTVSPTFTLWSL